MCKMEVIALQGSEECLADSEHGRVVGCGGGGGFKGQWWCLLPRGVSHFHKGPAPVRPLFLHLSCLALP